MHFSFLQAIATKRLLNGLNVSPTPTLMAIKRSYDLRVVEESEHDTDSDCD